MQSLSLSLSLSYAVTGAKSSPGNTVGSAHSDSNETVLSSAWLLSRQKQETRLSVLLTASQLVAQDPVEFVA